MRRALPPLAFIAALLSLTSVAEPARACVAPPACASGLFGTEGIEPSLPASIAGLPTYGAKDGDFVLRTTLGVEVPTKLALDGEVQYLTTGALAPGAYTVASRSCRTGDEETVKFDIIEAAPAPTRSGAVSVASAERSQLAFPSSNTSTDCRHAVDAAVVMLDIAPDASVTPYLPVAVWETTVDGKVWSRVLPVRPATIPSWPSSPWNPLQVRLYTACDGLDHGSYGGLTPGTHDVEVRALLVGGSPIEAAQIRVRVSCGDKNGEVVDPAGPLENEPPVTRPAPKANGDAPSSEGVTPAPVKDGCDCTTSPSSSSGRLPMMMSMTLLAGALFRVRRRLSV